MSRLIRLNCPACKTLIETSVEEELRVTLLCAVCHKQFTAKVPPKPVTARSTQPATSRPVSARPVLAPGRLSDSPRVDPLLDVPLDIPLDINLSISPTAYQPARRRKPLDLRPVLMIVGSLVGILLSIFVVLYAWHWIANTDWSTFSVVPDSHQRLADDWFERIERSANENAKQLGEGIIDIEQAKRRMAEGGAWSENMLVRAVRLGKAPLEKKAAFKERQEALDKKARSLLDAKLAELKASGQPPSKMPELSEMLRQNPGLIDTMTIVFALPAYMGNAVFDLPAPVNDTEKIYYDEADLVHAYLKKLTMVRNTAQSERIADEIQELADKVMELAIQRSKLPANRFERVPREYVSKDKGFEAAQKGLIARIRRDAKPDEKLKDAVANFNDARDLLIHASSGLSDVTLRSRFAEARKLRGETTKRGPGDPFFEVIASSSERELVVKPRRQSEPDPVLEPPPMSESKPLAVEPRPQPAPESVASNTPPASPPSTRLDSAATDATINSEPSKLDTQAPPTPSPRFPSKREQMMSGLPPGTAPNFGPPVDGQAAVFPSPGFGAPPPGFGAPPPGFGAPPPGFGAPPPGFGQPGAGGPPPLDKAQSVKIVITSNKLDGNKGNTIVQQLASRLQSGNYRMNASNGKTILQIQYTGELERVVKLIDFGKVTLIDTPERTIHVVGE